MSDLFELCEEVMGYCDECPFDGECPIQQEILGEEG